MIKIRLTRRERVTEENQMDRQVLVLAELCKSYKIDSCMIRVEPKMSQELVLFMLLLVCTDQQVTNYIFIQT